MIGDSPSFTYSKYFKAEPTWHMLDGASDKEKKEFEEFMNDKKTSKVLKESHPEMSNPYINWQGKLIDKG